MEICQNTEGFSNMVSLAGNMFNAVSGKDLFDKNWRDAHNQEYHTISMYQSIYPNRILPPAMWDHPKPWWFDWSSNTRMSSDKMTIHNRLLDNVPRPPPADDTPYKDSIDPQQPDISCTRDPPKTKA